MLSDNLKQYKVAIMAALVVMVITAWFSVGFYHPDEHFQVLEFANYKLGLSPASDLPWEFGAQCRPAMQPFMVYVVASLLMSMGCYNPFATAVILRLLTALLTWATTLTIVNCFIDEFTSPGSKKWWVYSSLLLWFIPYFGVRFTAETISGDLLFLSIGLFYHLRPGQKGKGILWLVAGTLLGLAVYLRLQLAFACIGIALWGIFQAKWPLRVWLCLIGGGFAAMLIGLLADRWFYGQWVFTPYNYFDVNILKNVAAKFGVDPWWYYFVLFFNLAVPPVSIALLFFFFIGFRKSWSHLFSFICFAFFIGHFAIGHKEMRFLLPVTLAFIFLVIKGLESILITGKFRKTVRATLTLIVVTNVALLTFKMFTPAEEIIKYYHFIDQYTKGKTVTIVGLKKSPYLLDPVEVNFYKPKNLHIVVAEDSVQLRQIVSSTNGEVIYLSRTLAIPPEIGSYHTQMIYCQYPEWLLRFNINHWEERSYLWAVFTLKL